MAKKLTPISVEKARSNPTKRIEIPDAGKPGLYLVIQPSGAKSWAVRYRVNGKPGKLTLDGFPSLATARKLAQEALDRVAEGKDPAAEKRAARGKIAPKPDLFANIARQFIEKHAKPKTPRTWRQTAYRLGFNPDDLTLKRGGVVDRWGKRPIGEIKKRDVIELLDGIKERAPVMATNVFAVIRKLFNWAVARDIIATSPCLGIETPTVVESRDRVLTDDEIKRLWNAAGELGYPFGHITKLLLLTGQRRDEVAGMTWGEIDGHTWTIPKERAKNSKAHDVPLSDATRAVIEEVKASPRVYSPKGLLFTKTGDTAASGFSKAKTQLDELTGKFPSWRLHDIRRTVATGMQRLHVPLEVTEAVLNHIAGTRAGIVGIYQRHDYFDEKRQALEAWSAHLMARVEGRAPGKVLPIRGKR
jgi:integrase